MSAKPSPRTNKARAVPPWLKALRWRIELGLRNFAPFGFRSRKKQLFFPGCSLPSSDPALTAKVYDHLRERNPDTGLWSACCGRPLTQFVSKEAAAPLQQGLVDAIRRDGIEELIVACGNCNDELSRVTAEVPSVRIVNLYDLLAEERWDVGATTALTVHHPCPARRDDEQRQAFERLATQANLNLVNPGKGKHPLACCLIKTPSANRKREALSAAGAEVVTYCAHCTRAFQPNVPTRHVLQLLFGSTERWRPVSLFRSFINYFKLARSGRHTG